MRFQTTVEDGEDRANVDPALDIDAASRATPTLAVWRRTNQLKK